MFRKYWVNVLLFFGNIDKSYLEDYILRLFFIFDYVNGRLVKVLVELFCFLY